ADRIASCVSPGADPVNPGKVVAECVSLAVSRAAPKFSSKRSFFMATAAPSKPRAVKQPSVKDQPLFINGKFVDGHSNKTFPAINPASGDRIWQVTEADKNDVDQAVKAARKALESSPWKTMDAADRGRLLYKLADLAEKNAEELAVLESYNSGKT